MHFCTQFFIIFFLKLFRYRNNSVDESVDIITELIKSQEMDELNESSDSVTKNLSVRRDSTVKFVVGKYVSALCKCSSIYYRNHNEWRWF